MRPRTALLARPHPVIADAIRGVLAAGGLEPHALSSREELLRWPSDEVALIVVSTSVHSTVQASFEDVIRTARRAHPAAALVIGTVVETGRARTLLADMLAVYGIEGRLRTAEELVGMTHDPRETGRDILLVNRQELAQEAGRSVVAQAIARLTRTGIVVGENARGSLHIPEAAAYDAQATGVAGTASEATALS